MGLGQILLSSMLFCGKSQFCWKYQIYTVDAFSSELLFWQNLMNIENILYLCRVIHKMLSHKTDDKMQEKMKMILQIDENLAHL